MFKHESDEVCEDGGVETCQTPKNACVGDFNLPIGASELMRVMDDASFFLFFSFFFLQPCIIKPSCNLGVAFVQSFETSSLKRVSKLLLICSLTRINC